MRPFLTVLCLLLLCAGKSALALPPEIEADKLQLEIVSDLKEKHCKDALGKFERIIQLGVPVPESFHYHWGNAALCAGDPAEGMKHLDIYLTRGGSNAKFYKEALDLYIQAEKQLAQVKAEEEKSAAKARAEAERQAILARVRPLKDCPDCPDMVVIPAGRFMMGNNTGDANARPAHEVSIPAFAILPHEVTLGEWKKLFNAVGVNINDACALDTCPVRASWSEASYYAHRLSSKTKHRYRLPTEAEWEYACRASGSQAFCGGDDQNVVAWHPGNSRGAPHPAAQKQPNAFGLYDMSGNVWEWTGDCWHETYVGAPADGSAWTEANCSHRVQRGGSFVTPHNPEPVSATTRHHNVAEANYSNVGFRLVRELEPGE